MNNSEKKSNFRPFFDFWIKYFSETGFEIFGRSLYCSMKRFVNWYPVNQSVLRLQVDSFYTIIVIVKLETKLSLKLDY